MEEYEAKARSQSPIEMGRAEVMEPLIGAFTVVMQITFLIYHKI